MPKRQCFTAISGLAGFTLKLQVSNSVSNQKIEFLELSVNKTRFYSQLYDFKLASLAETTEVRFEFPAYFFRKNKINKHQILSNTVGLPLRLPIASHSNLLKKLFELLSKTHDSSEAIDFKQNPLH